MERLFEEDIEINELGMYYFPISIGPILDRKPRRPKRMMPNN
ncbi:MAG: hypothetical protein ACE5J5_03130 [Candidatus Hydrothermarchaeales archaeon]